MGNEIMWGRKRAGKYNAKRSVYKGHLYASNKEAAYARDLDVRIKAGELVGYRRQQTVRLAIGQQLICRYIVDFVEEYPDGSETWVEVKGYETPEWRLKWKLFEALHPEKRKQVIR